ncbi:hypothetical protein [Bacteroides ovatus]|uniref:hypothetical protein n=1 Tax=Bacteroides ovatus TaxID=28116 RepID=UPI0002DA6D56|nr:hypothetical protein [Bacteroides ovatus]
MRHLFPSSGLSFRPIGVNSPLKQIVVAKVLACVAMHNPAPGIVAPLRCNVYSLCISSLPPF